jgi:DNA-binding transcriptional ArsR family regulator
MVYYSSDKLTKVFSAVSDPTRRALLAELEGRGDMSVSDLAKPFDMSLPAVMKHLDVLSDAGLITRNKQGRTVTCRLTAEPMEQAMEWLSRYQRFWSAQLDRLVAFVEKDACSPSQASPSQDDSRPAQPRSTPPGPTPKK